MALRLRSRDIRLYVGGRRVHGDGPTSRVLRSIGWTSENPTFAINAIGDVNRRFAYTQEKSGTIQAGGWLDDEAGLQPMLDAVLPSEGGSALPVTVSAEGGAARTRSVISQHAEWDGRTITTPEGEAVMIEATGKLSEYGSALCIGEGQQTGGSPMNVGDLDLQTQPIPIRLGSPRVELISGGTAMLFNVDTALYNRYLHIGSDVVLVPNLTGVYRVTSEVPNAGGFTAVTVELPGGGVINAPSGIRDAITGFRVVDTFSGTRIGLVHVSNVAPRDAVNLTVALQGTAPGTNAFTDVGTPIEVGIAGEGAGYARAFLFVLPEGVRSVGRVRAQLRWTLTGGAQSAANNLSAFVRADFQPDVVHH